MFIEIYKQNDRQIKAEIFYKHKTFLKHWFKMNEDQILLQRYEEIHNEYYNKKEA